MKKVYKYKENRQLKIGETYDFWIVKQIQLPDGNEYYIMKDPFGEKHLLPARFYKHYKIKPLSFYTCKVDKVNCQGRLFFEPRHPVYTVGDQYLFCFEKPVFLVNKKGILNEFFLMKGENGENAYLHALPNNIPKKGVFRNYRVYKIKKARVFIEKP